MTLSSIVMGRWLLHRKREELALQFAHHQVARHELLNDVGRILTHTCTDQAAQAVTPTTANLVLQRLLCETMLPLAAKVKWKYFYDLVHPWLATYALQQQQTYTFYLPPRLLSEVVWLQQLIILNRFLQEVIPLLSTVHPITISLHKQGSRNSYLELQHPGMRAELVEGHQKLQRAIYAMTVEELIFDDSTDGVWQVWIYCIE